MKIPSYLTRITPLSKIIALFLFIALPVASFYFGFEYHSLIAEPSIQYITKEKIEYKIQPDNERAMIKRCGEYPDLVQMNEGKWSAKIAKNIAWAPDCRNLAWSNNQVVFCENGPGGNDNCSQIPSSPNNGLYIYHFSSKRVERVLSATLQDKDPTFLKWIDSSTFLYTDRLEKDKKEYKIRSLP